MAKSAANWLVDHDESGVRLDKFLARESRLGARGRAVSALERRKVFINGQEASRAQAARRLVQGDVVSLWVDRPGSAKRSSRLGPGGLEIVYEDEALIVVNKPAGLLTVPLERQENAWSVYDELEQHLRSRGKRKPLVVHRIDRDTSGLVVFTKNAVAQADLKQQFRRHEPERVYLAVVYGDPFPKSGTWHDRLVWDQRALMQKETDARDPRGKEAIADYRVVESFDGAALIEVRLKTGKRNQIRLQARLRGHTLIGEERYTHGPESLRPIDFPRQALHASRLSFRHPGKGTRLEFEAPMPADLTDLIAGLRRSTLRSRVQPAPTRRTTSRVSARR